MAKRILWLLNHTTLRKFEVPMLLSLGYEVFCPKVYELEYGDYSASITYEYDKTLTIPADVLEKLNLVDFYSDVSAETMELLNQYFDIAITMFTYWPIRYLTRGFKGAVGLRAFGLEDPSTYSLYLHYWGGTGVFNDIRAMGNRFWFMECYDNLHEIEAPILKNNSLFLPIGMANAKQQNRWIGGDKRILFISPKIKVNVYYEQVYNTFKRDFGDIPHVLGGAQPLPVPEDETVTGYLTDEQYTYNMQHLSAMFYHSQEKHHLHYHPLEAVKWGMPLVFMAGGLLDKLGGNRLPGRCTTVDEAHRKLEQLVKGNKELIKSITQSQSVLLDEFQTEKCAPFWRDGMKQIEHCLSEQNKSETKQKKRIALILPAAYTGGVLDFALRFTEALQQKIIENDDNVQLVIGHLRDIVYNKKDYFKNLRELGVQERLFSWEGKGSEWAERAMKLAGYYVDNMSFQDCCIAEDGAANFEDCDYTIYFSDLCPLGLPFFCLHPYSVIAHDYIGRYEPTSSNLTAEAVKLANQRHSDYVIVTSDISLRDAMQYGGITKDRVIRIPMLLAVPQPKIEYSAHSKPQRLRSIEENRMRNYERIVNRLAPNSNDLMEAEVEGYFIWSTNAAPHKNHLRALEALRQYYERGGKMICVVTGANTQYLSPDEPLNANYVSETYVGQIHYAINNSALLQKNISIIGDLSKEEYFRILKKAKFVFHPGIADNGNGTIYEAACLGIPTLSSDYPAMRWMASYTGMWIRFMNGYDSEMMADALWDMENNHMQYAQNIPPLETLELADYRHKAEELYHTIKKIVAF
ncbi:MAG: hypothetical protein IKH57_09125 [Clostridia bacterium]|nr:hypothetical protein [Clostridia bacterium]